MCINLSPSVLLELASIKMLRDDGTNIYIVVGITKNRVPNMVLVAS